MMGDELTGTGDVGTTEGEARKIGRRDALKKGAVGAGVVGVVWAAPAISGLSLTPAYAAASSGLSTNACLGDATFNLSMPCPPPGVSSTDVTPTGTSPTPCGIQGITTDTHFADAHPHDANKPVADQFDKVTINDASGRFLLFNVKRSTGNTHCKFTGVNFDGVASGNGAPWQQHSFNPTNHTANGRPTKYTGVFQTSDQIAIGFAYDYNERGDIGQQPCGGTAHITLTCT